MEDIRTIKQRFEIIGNDIKLNRAIEKAIQVAPTDFTVLITGRVAWGKRFSPGLSTVSAPVNMHSTLRLTAGGPGRNYCSELFGHEKGSFTGALSDRKGLLRGQ